MTPIGFYKTLQKYTYDAPRQTNDHSACGIIELLPHQNFEQALIGLEKFSHIWILFQFHKNSQWKPMVMPPRGSENKVGVFATRAPYRPNFIGMSSVELTKIEGLRVFIKASDLLDRTPVLDIKPYLSYCDSIPTATEGWIKDTFKYVIHFSDPAKKQISWLSENSIPIESFILNQLEFEPTNFNKKRVRPLEQAHLYEISYRTWRVQFSIIETSSSILVEKIYSGYSTSELNDPHDPYQDKELHRLFMLLI